MPISQNIKAICTQLNSRNHGISTDAPNDIGCFASLVAEVAKLAGIPDNEASYESMGARSFYQRMSSSGNCFSELGPSYMKTREHKHWYHLGQNYQHAASYMANPDFDSDGAQTMRPQQRHLHLQLNQELASKLGTNDASCRAMCSSNDDGLLQSEMSGNSSQEKSMDYSSSSTPTSAASVSTNASFSPAPHDNYLA